MLRKQTVDLPFAGGIDTKESAEAEGPAGFRSLTGYRYGALLGQLERTPMPGEGPELEEPAGTEWTGSSPSAHTLFTRGNELCALTAGYGVTRMSSADGVDSAFDWLTARTTSSTPTPSRLTVGPAPVGLERKIIHSVAHSADTLGIDAVTATNTDDGLCYVVGWIERRANSANGLLHLRAYTLENNTEINVASRVVTLAVAGGQVCVSSCAYVGGDAGAIVTVSDSAGGAGATVIDAYHYSQSTRTWTGPVALVSTANNWFHSVTADPATGGFFLAYAAAGTSFLTVDIRASLAVVTNTYLGVLPTLSAPCLVTDWGDPVLVVYSDVARAYWALFDPATGANVARSTLYVAAASEQVLGVQAGYQATASEPQSAAVFITISDGSIVAAPAIRTIYQERRWTGATLLLVCTANIPNAFALGKPLPYQDRCYAPMAHYRYEGTGAKKLTSALLVRPMATAAFPDPAVEAVARFCHDRAWGYPGLFAPTTAATWALDAVSGNLWCIALCDSSTEEFTGIGSLPQTLALVRIDLTRGVVGTTAHVLPHAYVDEGDTTLLAAGILSEYDGIRCTESQPLTAPAVRAGSAGQYARALYSFVDAAGRLHRSEPSLIVDHLAGDDVYVEIPPFTAFDGETAPRIACELYTSADAQNFYLARVVGGFADHYDSISANGCFFVFAAVLAADTSATPLYTNGGELGSAPPPCMYHVANVGDRLFGVDAEDRRRLWASKPRVAGYAYEWHTALTVPINDDAEGVEDINGAPFIFCRNGVYMLPGVGPDARGVGLYAPPVKITSLGCVSKNSIARTPHGIVYQSARGFALLNGAGQVVEIGRPIESLTAPGVMGPARRCVYDPLLDSLTVAARRERYYFSFANQAWGHDALPALTFLADQVRLPNGTQYYAAGLAVVPETAATSNAAQIFETPWIKLDGIAGFGRLWSIILALRSRSIAEGGDTLDAELLVELFVDFSLVNPSCTFAFTGAEQLALWGLNEVHDLVLLPKKQRCQAIKIRCTSTGGTATSGLIPLSLRLRCGVDPKGARLAPARNRAAPT